MGLVNYKKKEREKYLTSVRKFQFVIINKLNNNLTTNINLR